MIIDSYQRCFVFDSSLSPSSSSLVLNHQRFLSSSSPSCYKGSFHRRGWEDITRLVANFPKLLRHPLIWIILLRALLSSRENIFSDFEKCSGRKIKLNEPAKFQAVQKNDIFEDDDDEHFQTRWHPQHRKGFKHCSELLL